MAMPFGANNFRCSIRNTEQRKTFILELPANVKPYKKTPVFTEQSVPAGLLKDHATRPDVWGVINVLAGELRYEIPSLSECHILEEGTSGVIEPQRPHFVTPQGPVRFFVEFYR